VVCPARLLVSDAYHSMPSGEPAKPRRRRGSDEAVDEERIGLDGTAKSARRLRNLLRKRTATKRKVIHPGVVARCRFSH
jgi:hypothetical protein